MPTNLLENKYKQVVKMLVWIIHDNNLKINNNQIELSESFTYCLLII
jgi:hypothetical protein